MHILLTCNYSPWSKYSGGGQKSTHMLANALVDLGHQVEVIYSKAPWEKIELRGEVKYKISWALFLAIKPGISSPLRFLNAITFWYHIQFKKKSFDVLHSNGEEGALFFIFKFRALVVANNRYPKFESWIHRLDLRNNLDLLRVFFREPRHFGLYTTFSRSQSVFCTSNSSKNEVQKVFQLPAHKLKVVPNGIDPIFFKEQFSSSTSRNKILFFGRLTKPKGVDVLLEAFVQLILNGQLASSPYILRIVGHGPLELELKKFVLEQHIQDRVEFAGWKSGVDLLQEFKQARLMVLPSFEESFGNTHLETLAYGAPLITFDSGSISEVVQDKAIVLKEKTAQALAAAIEVELKKEPTQEEVQGRSGYVWANYSWEKTASLFLNEYKILRQR